MEQPRKRSSKEMIKRKSKSFFSMSRKTSNEKFPANSTPIEHPFIIAIHNAIQSEEKEKQYTTIQFYLRNPHLDPNVTSQEGYSALLLLTKEKAYAQVELLLKDHRVDVRNDYTQVESLLKSHHVDIKDDNVQEKSITNNNEHSQLLRHKMFARFTLDMVTYEQCKSIKSFYTNGVIIDSVLQIAIQKITQRIQHDEVKQIEDKKNNEENPVLPQSACLPDYATSEFIEKKIWFILSSFCNV